MSLYSNNMSTYAKACKVAGIPMTDRQASKFKNGHGAADRIVKKFGEKLINRIASQIEDGTVDGDELRDIRRKMNS